MTGNTLGEKIVFVIYLHTQLSNSVHIMIKKIFLLLLALNVAGAYAQNDEWFDQNGNILPEYLDDNGLLVDEYLADVYEFT